MIKFLVIIDIIVLFGTFGPAAVFSLGLLGCESISDAIRCIKLDKDLAICTAVFYIFVVLSFFGYVALS